MDGGQLLSAPCTTVSTRAVWWPSDGQHGAWECLITPITIDGMVDGGNIAL